MTTIATLDRTLDRAQRLQSLPRSPLLRSLPNSLALVVEAAESCVEIDGRVSLGAIGRRLGASNHQVSQWRGDVRNIDPALWPWPTRNMNDDKPNEDIEPAEVEARWAWERERRPTSTLRTDTRCDGPGSVYRPALGCLALADLPPVVREHALATMFPRPDGNYPMSGPALIAAVGGYVAEWKEGKIAIEDGDGDEDGD